MIPLVAPSRRGRKDADCTTSASGLKRHSEFMDELHAEYGGIVFSEIPGRKCCAVFSAELVHEVLVEQEPWFQPYYPTTSFNLIPSPCLATSRFEIHTKLEKLMSTAFSSERMPAYREAIVGNALTFRDRVGSDRTVDLKDETERYTWGALLDAVIGVESKVEPELVIVLQKPLAGGYPGPPNDTMGAPKEAARFGRTFRCGWRSPRNRRSG